MVSKEARPPPASWAWKAPLAGIDVARRSKEEFEKRDVLLSSPFHAYESARAQRHYDASTGHRLVP